MTGATIIAAREFKSIMKTPTFYVLAGISTAIWTFYFLRNLFDFAQKAMGGALMGGMGPQNIHYTVFVQHISLVNLVLIVVVPALTMRMFSEEKRMRTYDLLLTAPITATDIALGKFLAGFGVVASLVLVASLYPLATMLIASIEMSPLITSILGLLLIAAVYVAIGMFASSLTENMMLSVAFAVILNLTLWFIGAGAEMTDRPLVSAVFEHLAVGKHLFEFLKGSLRMSSLTFFLSSIFLFCFLTQRVVESSRWR